MTARVRHHAKRTPWAVPVVRVATQSQSRIAGMYQVKSQGKNAIAFDTFDEPMCAPVPATGESAKAANL